MADIANIANITNIANSTLSGDPKKWRKATILADATIGICSEREGFTGNMCIDDEYLVGQRNFNGEDLKVYR